MIAFYLGSAISIGFWSGVLILRWIRCPSSTERETLLRRRLRDYARMKDSRPILPAGNNEIGFVRLPPDEHEILLGILKKVEAKNGVLATIWSLFFACVTTTAAAGAFIVKTAGSTDWVLDGPVFAATASLFIIMGAPFLMASIVGTRQIDNFLCNGWREITDPNKSVVLLQKTLMGDALLKEELLWISQRAAVIYAFVLPVLVTIALWAPIFSNVGN